MVTQEFSLVETMTVAENVALSSGSASGGVDARRYAAAVMDAMERLGVHIEPDRLVATLSIGERQRVEIVKALFHDCRVLILDEPTAVLTPQDVRALFATIRRLTQRRARACWSLPQAAGGRRDLRPGRRAAARAAGRQPGHGRGRRRGAGRADDGLGHGPADGDEPETGAAGGVVARRRRAAIRRSDRSPDGEPALCPGARPAHRGDAGRARRPEPDACGAGEIVGVAGI